MHSFETILLTVIFLGFLAGVFALIYKGSRPPQRLPENPTPPKKAAVASLIPIVRTAILYATFRGLGLYLDRVTEPSPLAILSVLIGVIAPWCVGIYFAYRAARAENKVLRAIGSLEVLLFLLAVAVLLVAHG